MRKTIKYCLLSGFITALLLSGGSVFYRYILLHEYSIFTEPAVAADVARSQIASDALSCEWSGAPYFFFSQNVFSPLIYYSHLFPAIAACVLAFLVWRNGKKQLLNRLFVTLALLFVFWSLFDLILWASENPDLVMFFWSTLIYIDLSIYFASAYLLYVFVNKTDLPNAAKLVGLLLFLPVIFFAPTTLNLAGFDYTNCDREAIEGPLWYYVYLVEILLTVTIATYAIWRAYWTTERAVRIQIVLLTAGVSLFLFAFSLGNLIGSFSEDWSIAQYGLFGMPIFLGCITYLITQYQVFRIRIISTAAFVFTLWILLFSILLLKTIESARPVIIITLILFAIIGYLLIRSVKQEIAARERNEELAKDLARANIRLRELDRQKSEFVSIASHQLRSPLTSIRGYASMLAEGSFGKLPQKAMDVAARIQEASSYMALSIEDFLNVSRIEQGNMKYENADTNIKQMAEQIVEEMRASALKKGLLLMFRSSCDSDTIANIDPGKTRQTIYNLIDNALKYTPKGHVDVVVTDNVKLKKIFVAIRDTGVGMSEDAVHAIFYKFVRAKNANKVNVTGTGLGLYVAKQMIEAMGGRIGVKSDGEGKGSTFTIELPLVS